MKFKKKIESAKSKCPKCSKPHFRKKCETCGYTNATTIVGMHEKPGKNFTSAFSNTATSRP